MLIFKGRPIKYQLPFYDDVAKCSRYILFSKKCIAEVDVNKGENDSGKD